MNQQRCKKCGRMIGKKEHLCVTIPWNRGKECSKEAKEKMRKAKLGKKLTPEHREKVIKTLLLKENPFRFKKGLVPWNKGKKGERKPQPKYVPKGRPSGGNHYLWKEDRTQLKKYKDSEEKRSPAYKYWRKTVCDRDSWKCRIKNEDCSGRLEVHHILSWRDYPELRYEKNNGICLCKFHHPRKREDEVRLSPYFREIIIKLT